MKIANSITALIGGTPLVYLDRFNSFFGGNARLIGKLESFNPTGSIKDRAAYAMLAAAKDAGQIGESTVIIEPTSGNTGIGLACACASMGLRLIITMPESMSIERRKILSALGAEVVLTDAALGMKGAISKAESLLGQIADSFMPQQFENKANPDAHYKTTGREIWDDCGGKIDILVCGVGTGGTISGAGMFLKEKKPKLRIVAVEPKSSAVLSGGSAGAHKIQGIGAGFVPSVLNTDIYTDVMAITSDAALEAMRTLAKTEGILCGISSGAALSAAVTLSQDRQNRGLSIVVILPDDGARYLSVL